MLPPPRQGLPSSMLPPPSGPAIDTTPPPTATADVPPPPGAPGTALPPGAPPPPPPPPPNVASLPLPPTLDAGAADPSARTWRQRWGNNPVAVAVVGSVCAVVVLVLIVTLLGEQAEPRLVEIDQGGNALPSEGLPPPAENVMLPGDLVQVCEGVGALHAGEYVPADGDPVIEAVALREGSWSYVGDETGAELTTSQRPAAGEVDLDIPRP